MYVSIEIKLKRVSVYVYSRYKNLHINKAAKFFFGHRRTFCRGIILHNWVQIQKKLSQIRSVKISKKWVISEIHLWTGFITGFYGAWHYGVPLRKFKWKQLFLCPVPEFIDPVFAKTSRKRSLSVIENKRFRLVFAKTGSSNSGTVLECFFVLPSQK